MVVSLTATVDRKEEEGKASSFAEGGLVLDRALRRLIVCSALVFHTPLLGCIIMRIMSNIGNKVK
jgi:hypothetical protein